ncbi:MAG: hypothetical protein BMS9Abin33_1230 [Gammaproteobacteria bacterium]|nr:MAG: hypothetical protein BMS9Abin33_1230 [Gammaproteobacteria bacterium]
MGLANFQRKGSNRIFQLEKRIKYLEQELSCRENNFTLLKQAIDAVTGELDVGRVLKIVGEQARKLVSSETLLVPVLNPECTEYTYRAGNGENAEKMIGQTLPVSFDLFGWVWKHQKAWWHGMFDQLSDADKDRLLIKGANTLLVPLRNKQNVWGGLAAINKTDQKQFSRRDLDLLTMFANQAGVAIENASFFEQLNKTKKHAERLNRRFEKRIIQRTADLKNINKELEQLALYDPLTGLPNRSLIKDRLKQGMRVADRENGPLSIMLMDLDHFKQVNDTLGHIVGDELLMQVGNRIQHLLRKSDTIGRLGGDEFVIVLPGSNKENAATVATKIIESLDLDFNIDNNLLNIKGSVGIAFYPEHGENEVDLLKHADVAMYNAKRSHEGYSIFSQENH